MKRQQHEGEPVHKEYIAASEQDAHTVRNLVAAHLKPGLSAGPVVQDLNGVWGFIVTGTLNETEDAHDHL
jgi:hypothetical protein